MNAFQAVCFSIGLFVLISAVFLFAVIIVWEIAAVRKVKHQEKLSDEALDKFLRSNGESS
jgi:hypothetical protein